MKSFNLKTGSKVSHADYIFNHVNATYSFRMLKG